MHRKPHPDTEHSLILDSVGTEKGRELIVSGDKTGRWNSRFDLSLGQKVSETQRPNGKCKMRETISKIVGGLLALLFNINDNDLEPNSQLGGRVIDILLKETKNSDLLMIS